MAFVPNLWRTQVWASEKHAMAQTDAVVPNSSAFSDRVDDSWEKRREREGGWEVFDHALRIRKSEWEIARDKVVFMVLWEEEGVRFISGLRALSARGCTAVTAGVMEEGEEGHSQNIISPAKINHGVITSTKPQPWPITVVTLSTTQAVSGEFIPLWLFSNGDHWLQPLYLGSFNKTCLYKYTVLSGPCSLRTTKITSWGTSRSRQTSKDWPAYQILWSTVAIDGSQKMPGFEGEPSQGDRMSSQASILEENSLLLGSQIRLMPTWKGCVTYPHLLKSKPCKSKYYRPDKTIFYLISIINIFFNLQMYYDYISP